VTCRGTIIFREVLRENGAEAAIPHRLIQPRRQELNWITLSFWNDYPIGMGRAKFKIRPGIWRNRIMLSRRCSINWPTLVMTPDIDVPLTKVERFH